jgi:hypothetical protein
MDTNDETHEAIARFLDEWRGPADDMKGEFLKLMERLSSTGGRLSFIPRPGISYSLRGFFDEGGKTSDRLLVMVDVIDDDPENRWLSVCFYGDDITDPDELGDLVPQGLLGEDGYCFDLMEHDDELLAYVAERIGEAYAHGA